MPAILAFIDKFWPEIVVAIMGATILGEMAALHVQGGRLQKTREQLAWVQAQEKAAADHARAVDAQNADLTKAAQNQQTKIQTVIEWRTRTITQEVPNVITPKIDTDFRIPYGALRLYDASARGVELSGVPLPAGQSDDAAASVDWRSFAAVAAANNGTCLANAAELSGLQEWIRNVHR